MPKHIPVPASTAKNVMLCVHCVGKAHYGYPDTLNDKQKHCIIRYMGTWLTISDVSSTGGTWVQHICRNFAPYVSDISSGPQLVCIHGCNMIISGPVFFQPESKMDLDLNISNLRFHGISSEEISNRRGGSSQNNDWKHVPANKVQHTGVLRQCQLRVLQYLPHAGIELLVRNIKIRISHRADEDQQLVGQMLGYTVFFYDEP